MIVRVVGVVVIVTAIGVIGFLMLSLTGARSDIDALRAVETQLTSDLSAADEAIDRLEDDLMTANDEIAALVEVKAKVESDLDEAERDISTLRADKTQLEFELVIDRATIDGLRQGKAALESGLATALDEIDALTSSLSRIEGRLDEAERNIVVLRVDKTRLESDLADERETTDELRQDKTILESDLATAKSENLTLVDERDALSVDLESANAAREQTASELQTALTANETLRAEKEEIEKLHGDIDELRQEIDDLKRQREPLILSKYWTGVLCSGSMEPKLTCLDEILIVTNPRPEDIIVGSLISFDVGEKCEDGINAALHRVIDVKIEDDTYYYWPKGDANDEPDGCWVSESDVLSYVTDIRKDVRLENTALREGVQRAYELWDEAEADYKTVFQEYNDYCDRWDPGRVPPDCTVPLNKFAQAKYLYDRSVAAFEYWMKVGEYGECWQNAVNAAFYNAEGEVVFPPCLRPRPYLVPPPLP